MLNSVRLPPKASGYATRRAGKHTVAVAPTFTSLSRLNVPPCSSHGNLTSGSPRPVPAVERAVLDLLALGNPGGQLEGIAGARTAIVRPADTCHDLP